MNRPAANGISINDNRKRLPEGLPVPKCPRFPPDATTRDVMALVGAGFADHFGDLEPFGWAVTREDALRALHSFVRTCLADFGDYQDAMKAGDGFLFHSVLSPVSEYRPADGGARSARRPRRHGAKARHRSMPLKVFIRQILGWREYVRGIYWMRMPGYVATNALHAERTLPWFYWSGETDLNCLMQAIGDIRRTAYGHHIQRLMVTGNFALLAGVAPAGDRGMVSVGLCRRV